MMLYVVFARAQLHVYWKQMLSIFVASLHASVTGQVTAQGCSCTIAWMHQYDMRVNVAANPAAAMPHLRSGF